ncbi:MAG: phosphoribosyl-ATP diphosphatase [Gammaproteobacteria bacterium]|nr:phosphoribosyl-ATP diphosphatase [Gammaproteobacteria bacterium]MBH44770.1 phosphoribosyl-ATP diphosphatase [Gammaproteobacteria bacterium]|tara:strand:- start:481 stop:816 length:336 start_codon:yes stop_codon:yes gene_type:complete
MEHIKNDNNILYELDVVINKRKDAQPDTSYVASLFAKGDKYIGEKILEETNELIEAVNSKEKKDIIHETADIWFHSIVMLSNNNLSTQDVLHELRGRFGISGHDEKKLRNK